MICANFTASIFWNLQYGLNKENDNKTSGIAPVREDYPACTVASCVDDAAIQDEVEHPEVSNQLIRRYLRAYHRYNFLQHSVST